MAWAKTWVSAFALTALLAVGCGGGSGANTSPEERGESTATTSSGGEDPTEGGRRRATAGVDCDFGGAAESTCQRGLFCCYGPPDNPGDHGQCMAECPEY